MELQNVSGKLVLAIIGDPINQAKSPFVFNNYFQLHCINAEMVPFHVHPEDFETVLNGLRKIRNFAGAIITIPHKRKAFEIAAIKGLHASKTNSANVMVPIEGNLWACDMLDATGLLNALQKRKIEIKGLKTLIIGAGGAGSAIAVALREIANVGQIGLVDINSKTAEQLAAKLENAEVVASNPEGYQLVVNASHVGMGTQEIPLNPSKLNPGTIVCDAIMDPPITRLLDEAKKKGCVIVRGLEILEGQVKPILEALNLNKLKQNY